MFLLSCWFALFSGKSEKKEKSFFCFLRTLVCSGYYGQLFCSILTFAKIAKKWRRGGVCPLDLIILYLYSKKKNSWFFRLLCNVIISRVWGCGRGVCGREGWNLAQFFSDVTSFFSTTFLLYSRSCQLIYTYIYIYIPYI